MREEWHLASPITELDPKGDGEITFEEIFEGYEK